MEKIESSYAKELFKKIDDVRNGLQYYMNENIRLKTDLNYYKNAYENRINEYLEKENKNAI